MRASMWGMSNASQRLWMWLPSIGSCGPNMALTPPPTWWHALHKDRTDTETQLIMVNIIGLILADNGRQTHYLLDINSIDTDRDRYKHCILLCAHPLWPNYWWQSINGIDFHGYHWSTESMSSVTCLLSNFIIILTVFINFFYKLDLFDSLYIILGLLFGICLFFSFNFFDPQFILLIILKVFPL